MLKVALSVLMTTGICLQSFAGDNAPRNEQRTRIKGEVILRVSNCSSPSVNTNEEIVFDGGTDRNGNLRSHRALRVSGSSNFQVLKCQQVEDYMVSVTGNGWFPKESEIQGSAKLRGQLVRDTITKNSSQLVDEGRSNRNVSIGDLVIGALILEQVKSSAQSNCESERSQIQRMLVNIENSACANLSSQAQ